MLVPCLKISLMGAKKVQIFGDTNANANTQEKWKTDKNDTSHVFLMR
jgi:hypothetical protein